MKKIVKINFNKVDFSVQLHDEADESVLNEIFKHKEYRIADEVIKNSSTIIDLGAHKGFFALYARALNLDVQIFCVEPEKTNFAVLNENISKNKIKNVVTINSAIANKTGTANLVVTEDSHNHHLSSEPQANLQPVQVFTFGDFCAENNINDISLLKMDIEGGEYDVFLGMNLNDFKKIKNIVMEYHNYNGQNYKEIENQLRENGFSVQVFPSKFDKRMGFIFAHNKRV